MKEHLGTLKAVAAAVLILWVLSAILNWQNGRHVAAPAQTTDPGISCSQLHDLIHAVNPDDTAAPGPCYIHHWTPREQAASANSTSPTQETAWRYPNDPDANVSDEQVCQESLRTSAPGSTCTIIWPHGKGHTYTKS